MATQAKYQSAISLAQQLGAQNFRVEEDGASGVLRFWATVDNTYEKEQIWNAAKAAGGDNPSDFVADIQVANPGYYAKHTVESGESLSKIAKHYYGDMMKYNQIFDANRNILDDPDKIEVGQVLIIPNEQ